MEKDAWSFVDLLPLKRIALEELAIKHRPSAQVQTRILKFFGNVSRCDRDSIKRLIVQVIVEGTRPRGKSPMRWTDQ